LYFTLTEFAEARSRMLMRKGGQLPCAPEELEVVLFFGTKNRTRSHSLLCGSVFSSEAGEILSLSFAAVKANKLSVIYTMKDEIR